MNNTLWATLTITGLVSSFSAAQAEGTWIIGAVVEGETGYYVGHTDDVSLVPYISFETERFEFSLHNGVAFHALQRDGQHAGFRQVSLILTPRWEPDFSEDAIFDGLNRDTAIEAGARGQFQSGLFIAEAEALIDISDTHKGYEASAFVGLQYEVGAVSIEGGLGTRYHSSNLNQHLFGVSASEATSTRAAFSPGGSHTGFASVTVAYALSDNMAVVGDVTFESLGSMRRSPLVDTSSNTSVALGLIHKF
jgi:outer membrane protein